MSSDHQSTRGLSEATTATAEGGQPDELERADPRPEGSFATRLAASAVTRLVDEPRHAYSYGYASEPHRDIRLGMCLSGGGIRSAAFCLGALQRCRSEGFLEQIDHLSAVSGGGYIAAAHAITESYTDPAHLEDSPAWAPGSPEAKFLRANSDYLAPGLVGRAWLAINALWGVILNLTPILAMSLLLGGLSAAVLRPMQPGLEGRSVVGSFQIPSFVWMFGLTALAGSLFFVGLWRRLDAGAPSAAAGDQSRAVGMRSAVAEGLARTCLAVGLAVLGFFAGIPAAVWVCRIFLAAGWHLLMWQPFPWRDPTKGEVPIEGASFGTSAVLIGILVVMSLVAVALARRSRAFKTMLALAGLSGPLLVLFPALAMAHRIFAVSPSFDWEYRLMMLAGVVSIGFAVLSHNGRYSMHLYYRQRLGQVFAIRRTGAQAAESIDFDEPIWFSRLRPCAGFPELIMCTALNVSDRVVPHGRQSAPFTFTRSTCGSPVFGDEEFSTESVERSGGLGSPPLTLPSLVAISGAALSPVMGRLTIKPLRLLLAVLNVRLGVWIPNPSREWTERREEREQRRRQRDAQLPLGGRMVKRRSLYRRYPDAGLLRSLGRLLADGWREPGALYVWREAIGSLKLDRPFVYITDGGHWDNLGLVELVRRRCSHIVCFDASLDPNDTFGPLRSAIALCRVDLGVNIDIDPRPLRRIDGIASSDTAVGTIHYPDQPAGTIVYTRATICEDTSAPLILRAEEQRRFPDHSTGDQFFTDDEFEAFRALGHQAAERSIHATVLPGFRMSSELLSPE